MLVKFNEGVGGKLGDKAAALIFTPAFVFWAGGLLMWFLGRGTVVATQTWFSARSVVEQVALLFFVVFVVTVSGVVVQRIGFWFLRVLEGYGRLWPRRVREWARRRQIESMCQPEARWQELANIEQPTAEEHLELLRLDERLRHVPDRKDDYLPTRLGNTLRAAEMRISDKYGLEVATVWPRLWLLLPDAARTELSTSRAALNGTVVAILWGLLFVLWTPLHWSALPIATMWVMAGRVGARIASVTYGDLLESAFDLHRFSLYMQLRRPLPISPADEPAAGRRLSRELLRGMDPRAAEPYTTPTDESEKKP